MLTKLSLSEELFPVITKKLNGANVSHRGAFASNEKIDITVEVPRRLGASAVVLRINKDGYSDKDLPLSFKKTDAITDEYYLQLELSELCGEEGSGLFYYEFLFLRGFDTLFTNSKNNVDFSLGSVSQKRFLLLVHQSEFKTPEWFHGKIMYHIFVDRFSKGSKAVKVRDDVIINEDWENGVPQYPKKNGDAFSNNMFFGGTLWGVAEKLDYLKSLGVGVIYLSPIFKAYSNHKYDTGNYLEIDEMFGGEEAFENLIEKANKAGIKIMLDGVFNHTGNDSLYFDMYNKYGNEGAYINPKSPYREWYNFKKYPKDYETWWGIKILPKLNHKNKSCRSFFTAPGGVGEKYVKKGIGGWRLDVVDELPNEFLDEFCETVKAASGGQAVVLGEVWENAAEKIAYGQRRRYFRGGQLDSVMNYPLRNGILALLLDGDAEQLADTMKSVYSTYPKSVCDCLMNLLGTHDTERILTVLGDGGEKNSHEENSVLANKHLSEDQLELATKKLMLAAIIQYTSYGIPSVFYGDEAGLEGYHDPFCRKPFPWGKENNTILSFYKKLGEIRTNNANVFSEGDFIVDHARDSMIVYTRRIEKEEVVVIVNASEQKTKYSLRGKYMDLLTNEIYNGHIDAHKGLILKRIM